MLETTEKLLIANQKIASLRDALGGVMEQIQKGALVRETKDDGSPGWAMRQLPLVMALKNAQDALAKTPSTSVPE